MHPKHARQILQSLLQGIDPFTGQKRPAATVRRQAAALRALLEDDRAPEPGAARPARRAKRPRNVGRRWDDQEQRRLIDGFMAGDTFGVLADRHGRTLRAIETRLEKLGLNSSEFRLAIDRLNSAHPAPPSSPRKGAK